MIKNDVDTLEKIFEKSEFNFEFEYAGCFGKTMEHFTVKKSEMGYLLRSERTKKSHKVSRDKMDSLKNYLKTKIGTKDLGNCTTITNVRIGTFFNSIDYTHSNCGGSEVPRIDDFLNYSDLIN